MQTTETAKHTRGPWNRQGQWPADRGLAEVIESAKAGIVGMWIPASEDGRHADADLIAAAPELLAACREALAYFNTTDHGNGWRDAGGEEPDILAAAIAKAEGRA